MPICTYSLKLGYTCNSFFGEHQQNQEIEYYAKGYTSWLGMLAVMNDPLDVFNTFRKGSNKESSC
ncbi:MAG: hypothetical protein HRT37_05220 [Alteromonadaceae bacterium]|nr:hypothetical protein [Alteromonadaceae bacterium]